MMTSSFEPIHLFNSAPVLEDERSIVDRAKYPLNSFDTSMSFNGELLPEPTPISCEGMIPVRSVQLMSPSMATEDQDFLESLRNLLSKDNIPSSLNKGSDNSQDGLRCSSTNARLSSPQQFKSIFEQGVQDDNFPRMPFILPILSDNYSHGGDEQQRQFKSPLAQTTEREQIFSDDNDTTDDDYDFQSSSSTASGCASTCNDRTTTCASSSAVFRSSQLEQWQQRYQEMSQFRLHFGHCLVPLKWPSNPSLAHWVKRQRHQYRMKQEGKHSTLTQDRFELLERLNFVWDSHAAIWEERFQELQEFRKLTGHCCIPKKYPQNPQLAVWVKCQRRQFKLSIEGKSSNMTSERMNKLSSVGFVFTPRQQKSLSHTL